VRSRAAHVLVGAAPKGFVGPSATAYFSTGPPFAFHSDMEPSYMRTS
jgi:hypothetical protein